MLGNKMIETLPAVVANLGICNGVAPKSQFARRRRRLNSWDDREAPRKEAN